MGRAAIQRRHGTCVAFNNRAALLTGTSGSGKSFVALQLMALGCELISDDQTELTVEEERIVARCPPTIKGKIEARNFGILDVQAAAKANLVCVINLDIPETERLPQDRTITLCERPIRLFHNPGIRLLPFALLQYLKADSA